MESTGIRSEFEVYRALWEACAGPFTRVPRIGDLVLYFPQGHLDQVMASENVGGLIGATLALDDLPWKILCRVIQVHLKAQVVDDEVYAEITLLPEPNQDERRVEENNETAHEERMNIYSFTKHLTPSDTSTHGGFSILKKHADQCLPPLDTSDNSATQMLVAKDLHGNQWQFRHVFRGCPRRHLLTSGWAHFLVSKKLEIGDAFVFVRGDNGEVRVGVRRAMGRQIQSNIAGLFWSEILRMTHAISSRTNFTISYWPRRCAAEFVVAYHRYMNCVLNNYSIGMRFEMNFEGQHSERLRGTIVGIGGTDPVRWRHSKWNYLQVRWDYEATALAGGTPLPDRVSPWAITIV